MIQADLFRDTPSPQTQREQLISQHRDKSERFLSWIHVQPEGCFYEYVNWISRTRAAFKAELKIDREAGLSWKQEDEYTAWLWIHGAGYVIDEEETMERRAE